APVPADVGLGSAPPLPPTPPVAPPSSPHAAASTSSAAPPIEDRPMERDSLTLREVDQPPADGWTTSRLVTSPRARRRGASGRTRSNGRRGAPGWVVSARHAP